MLPPKTSTGACLSGDGDRERSCSDRAATPKDLVIPWLDISGRLDSVEMPQDVPHGEAGE